MTQSLLFSQHTTAFTPAEPGENPGDTPDPSSVSGTEKIFQATPHLRELDRLAQQLQGRPPLPPEAPCCEPPALRLQRLAPIRDLTPICRLLGGAR